MKFNCSEKHQLKGQIQYEFGSHFYFKIRKERIGNSLNEIMH